MSFSTPTAWNIDDLAVGRIIYVPPHKEVDPVTRKARANFQKFKVIAKDESGVQIVPYRGPEPADMPPGKEGV